MANTKIPALVGEARNPHTLKLERDFEGVRLVVRGIITLSVDGFLLARALRDAGCPDVDLLNEILEEAELVDDDNCYGYFIGAGVVRRLREMAELQATQEDPPTGQPEGHNPQVVAFTRARGPHPRVSYGWCSCGWQGPKRSDTHAADQDVSAHLRAVLPNDAEGSIHQ